MTEQSEREAIVATYEVDDRGLVCRNCGRASWLHWWIAGKPVIRYCERPDHLKGNSDDQ